MNHSPAIILYLLHDDVHCASLDKWKNEKERKNSQVFQAILEYACKIVLCGKSQAKQEHTFFPTVGYVQSQEIHSGTECWLHFNENCPQRDKSILNGNFYPARRSSREHCFFVSYILCIHACVYMCAYVCVCVIWWVKECVACWIKHAGSQLGSENVAWLHSFPQPHLHSVGDGHQATATEPKTRAQMAGPGLRDRQT